MLKIILIVATLMMFGCGVADKKTPTIIKDEPTFKLMYVKVNQHPFVKSEQVKVFSVVDGIAETSKGKIAVFKLEDNRSEFKLSVNSPNAQRIRILNIKPKYKDGIWLKAGKYHIEVSAKNYQTYKKWIKLSKDTSLLIKLKRVKDISVGTITWGAQSGVKYIDGLYWQDQIQNKTNKMNWYQAKKYCEELVINNNRVLIDDFRLPTESELFLLSKSNSELDYSGNICWSSSADQKHTQFAKYVYINSKKNGWYNKEGSSYVRCVSRKNYPSDISLLELTKLIEKRKKYKFLDALEIAVGVKYGKPIIKNVIYNSREKSLSFRLRSQKYDSNKKYYYDKTHTVPMRFHPKTLRFTPEVSFDVINDKLVFKSISNY